MPVQSTVGLTDPYVSIGLTAPTDFTTGFPFIDLMRTARDPFSGYENGQYFSDYLDADGWAHTVPDTGPITYHFDWSTFTRTDTSGELLYPELVANQSGTYVLEYKGEGSIEIFALDTIYRDDDGDGRIEFTVLPVAPSEGDGSDLYFGFDIVITATGEGADFDPDDPTHIRDITLVRAEHEDLLHAGAIFNPEWLEVVEDFREVRFMDWSQTNDSSVATLDDLPAVTEASWAEGIPLEIQVQLANQIGADPWFNIPHLLDADGVRAFVTYVRDTLDPDLVPTFEYSNEVWNPIFEQHDYVQDRAVEWFGDDAYLRDSETGQIVLDGTGAPLVSHYAVINAQMVLATQVAQIVDEVYAETPELDHVNAIGVSIGLGGSQEVMDQYTFAPMWEAADPGALPAYTPPYEVFDTVAATSYFGGNLLGGDIQTFFDAIDASLADPTFDIQQWLLDYVQGTNADFTDPVTGEVAITGSIPQLLGTLEDMSASISGAHPSGVTLDMGVTLYEGGQHLIHETPFLWEAATDADGNPVLDANGLPVIVQVTNYDYIQDVLEDFVRGDLITQAYLDLAAGWDAIGDGPFMQYGDVKLPGISGSFDLLAHHDDSTPLSETVYELNATSPVLWEDRGGVHFQQGLMPDLDGSEVYAGLATLDGNDLIEGTAAEDLLYGGAGDDTLLGYDEEGRGSGGDTLAGGAGNDVLRAGAGDDFLDGGLGNDFLDGGAGSDRYLFWDSFGADTVTGYDPALDVLEIDGEVIADLNALPQGFTASLTDTGTLLAGPGGSVVLEGYFAELGGGGGGGGGGTVTYALAGDDAQLFVIDAATGAVSYQGWFVPSSTDPWDADEDHIYQVSVIGRYSDGTEASRSDLEMVVTPDGVTWRDANDDGGGGGGGGGGTGGSLVYSIEGDDAQLFTVDPATGTISNQGWFTPSFDDPWDADEDQIYEVTLVATASDGTEASRSDLEMVVTAEGSTWRNAGEDPGDGGGGGGEGGGDPTTTYALDGADAFLFTLDPATGTIATQDWFVPSLDDPWDADEDHVYEVSLLTLDAAGTEVSRSDLEMVVAAEGITWRDAAPTSETSAEAMLASLMLDENADPEAALAEEDSLEAEVL